MAVGCAEIRRDSCASANRFLASTMLCGLKNCRFAGLSTEEEGGDGDGAVTFVVVDRLEEEGDASIAMEGADEMSYLRSPNRDLKSNQDPLELHR